MSLKLLASAAAASLALSATTAAAQANGQFVEPKVALAADSTFIQTAGSLGLLQAKLGKLAQEKGSSDVVRDFGKRMVDDYSQANEKLAAAAKQSAYPAPVMLRDHKNIYERISLVGRSSFDKTYMAQMVANYDDAARLFQQEADRGRVVSLKQVAAELLPMVQQHQSLATQTASTVGVDVTASN